jgi:hypothetical protein
VGAASAGSSTSDVAAARRAASVTPSAGSAAAATAADAAAPQPSASSRWRSRASSPLRQLAGAPTGAPLPRTVKTAKIIQVGAAKTTPRRVMDDATADAAAGSGKPATDDQAELFSSVAINVIMLSIIYSLINIDINSR